MFMSGKEAFLVKLRNKPKKIIMINYLSLSRKYLGKVTLITGASNSFVSTNEKVGKALGHFGGLQSLV